MTAVASPTYLKRHGVPKTPADLHHHTCINWRMPGSGAIHRWAFEKRGKRLEVNVEGALISNHQDIAVQAALQGLGIHYAYDDRIHGLIARGRLKRVLEDWSPTVPGLLFESPLSPTGPTRLRGLSA
jgi:DNA-binding transcriptional LysR family regulator